MEVTAVNEFWSTIDIELLAEIMGVCIGAFGVGYATGFKFYAFRRFLFGATG